MVYLSALGEVLGVVHPAEPRVCHSLVLASIVSARIDGLDLDAEGRQLLLHRFGNRLQRMLGQDIGAPACRRKETAHIVADRLIDLSDQLAAIGESGDGFRLPHGRGDEFHHGSGGPDPRDPSVMRLKTRNFH